jgi:hypothetical protein
MSRALEGLLSGLMQRTSHSKCHKTAAYVSKPLRVIVLVHQQKGYSRDAAGDGDEKYSSLCLLNFWLRFGNVLDYVLALKSSILVSQVIVVNSSDLASGLPCVSCQPAAD